MFSCDLRHPSVNNRGDKPFKSALKVMWVTEGRQEKTKRMWLAEGSKNLVIQIGVFLVYIFLGAIIFQALESHNEEEEREAMLLARKYFQQKYNISHDDMKVFINKIEEIVDHGFSQHWVKRWTILGSLFFAGTVVTTIGE